MNFPTTGEIRALDNWSIEVTPDNVCSIPLIFGFEDPEDIRFKSFPITPRATRFSGRPIAGEHLR